MNNFSKESYTKIMTATTQALREAGQIILDATVTTSQIEKKSDANYVTKIDYDVQNFLAEKLKQIIPESHLIAEESEKNIFTVERPSWILDPVDGTTNLIFDYKFSSISLALFLQGEPTCGFVYNPYLDELFIAIKGQGAQLNGERISVSTNSDLPKALIAFGTNPYDRTASEQTFAMIKDIFDTSLEIRRTGSAALDLAYVACGRQDGFFEQFLQPWDFAAGTIIVREAGGIVEAGK